MSIGVVSTRPARQSKLMFHWRARHLSLNAETGQVGTFSVDAELTDDLPLVEGRDGGETVMGRGMPRWVQSPSRGYRTQLGVQGNTAGYDKEALSFPWPLKVQAMSAYVRFWPEHDPGDDMLTLANGIFQLGESIDQGGHFTIYRTMSSKSWIARRTKTPGTIHEESVVAESLTAVWPLEILATLADDITPGHAQGDLQISTRDAAGQILVGTLVNDPGIGVRTDSFSSDILYIATGNKVAFAQLPGWLEEVKIARGWKTFAEMDELI
jgi:hypothetical protein